MKLRATPLLLASFYCRMNAKERIRATFVFSVPPWCAVADLSPYSILGLGLTGAATCPAWAWTPE